MTAAEIAQRYLAMEQTPQRLLKAKALAQRSQVDWQDVLVEIPMPVGRKRVKPEDVDA